MTRSQIRDLQRHIGAEPDGFWGPLSIAACQSHLNRLLPRPLPWPTPDQTSLRAFYGPPGDESALVPIDVSDLDIRYLGTPVRSVRAHRRIADSLDSILSELARGPHAGILRRYAGTYYNRPVRGGTAPSLHAYGAAIDLDPHTNGNRTHWPTRSTMPIEVMEIFARHGWLSAGAFWHRDAMHFQATA